jgi:hypothetical protein
MPDALSALTGDTTAAPAAAPVTQTPPTGGAPEAGAGTTQPTQSAPTDPAATETPALTLPAKDAPPEAWAEFYKAIGAPDKAEAYELPVPEGEDGAFAKTAAEWFKDAGLLPQQAQALASKWNEFTAAQAAAAQAEEAARIQALDTKNKAEEQALKTEWGQQHDANMELARRAVRQFVPGDKAADVVAALEDRLGYAETIKLMHAIGKGLGEHDAPGLGRSAAPARKSAAEILYGGSSA